MGVSCTFVRYHVTPIIFSYVSKIIRGGSENKVVSPWIYNISILWKELIILIILDTDTILLSSFEIIRRFGISRYIDFSMHPK